MKIKLSILISTILVTIFCSGCAALPGGIAASTVPITSNDTYTITKRNALGSDWGISILGLPIIPCRGYKALQDAKRDNAADALINVTGENKYIYLFFINWERMEVRGDAIKFQLEGSKLD